MRHFKHNWKLWILSPETKQWPYGKRWKSREAKAIRRVREIREAVTRTLKARSAALMECVADDSAFLRRLMR